MADQRDAAPEGEATPHLRNPVPKDMPTDPPLVPKPLAASAEEDDPEGPTAD